MMKKGIVLLHWSFDWSRYVTLALPRIAICKLVVEITTKHFTLDRQSFNVII